MRSLFLKVFLWFWGAMIALGLTLFLVVTTTRPDPLPKPWRESTSAALAAYASSAVSIWEHKGKAALAKYLTEQENKTRYRLNLCDESMQELSGRTPDDPYGGEFGGSLDGGQPGMGPPDGHRRRGPPDGMPPSDRGRPPDRGSPPDPPFELPLFGGPRGPRRPDDWKKLHRLALQSNEAIFELAGPRVLIAQSVQSNTGKRYVLQAVLPQPRFGRPAADATSQALGIIMMFIMSGLVCYGLVRYLTSPMVTLREATQQLAAGDLTARTGAAQRGRRDEVADLGRDFDAMAERIETLVVSQRRLLGDISHELRSPLARMSMALALARRHVTQGANADEINADFDRIKRESGRINTLIEQLLQLARLDSGEPEADTGLLDLEHLVRDIVADAEFEAKDSHRSVRILKSQSCHIHGSLSLLSSAIENVVRNAIRYTVSGTTVEVTLDCVRGAEHNVASVRVRDYGPGVPEEALANLFRPFYRVAEARDRATGGVGLGLAITERAVHAHGGSVTAENVATGGLLVELKLPVHPENR